MNEKKTDRIINLIKTKSVLKQKIFDNTHRTFTLLKEMLGEMASDYRQSISDIDARITVEYSDKGMFEAQIKVAGDILFFTMFTNAFEFDKSHIIWKNTYSTEQKYNTICGAISIYNFLDDSFRYHRSSDPGYLIARIFVNHEQRYFVEGKQQINSWTGPFESVEADRSALRDIVESAILYTMNFDLFVPPYDSVKIISVEQINSKIESERFITGKRLGFKFQTDDVSDMLKL